MTDTLLADAGKIDSEISQILSDEAKLNNSYVKIGILLNEVREKQYWKVLEYKSFGEYLKTLGERYSKGRTQLYHYFSTVRELMYCVSEENLMAMGIAKAAELKKYVKKYNRTPTTFIDLAIDSKTTTKQLRQIIFEQENETEEMKGTWFDQEGFFLTDEEKLVIQSADSAALNTDPVVPAEVPDCVKRKEARIRQAMEYLAAHSNAVKGES